MQLTNIQIVNFRGLKNISFDLPTKVSVIVGPNATGKSTILEAVRLVKSVLAPSFRDETIQTLTGLGAYIPALNAIKFESIAGTIDAPVTIGLKIGLSKSEIERVKNNLPRLAQIRIMNLLGASNVDSQLALVQYLSSGEGQQRFQSTLSEVNKEFENVEKSEMVELILDINPQSGELKGRNIFNQEIVTTLVRDLPPTVSLFSYFPADRALPSGEVNINLGSGDAQQQMFSHIAQPALKYQRLKQHLVNQILTSPDRNQMKEDFATIFNDLLTGKELAEVMLSPMGLLSVVIREKESGTIFDLDNMSSGEKGLLLTFFLMKRSVAEGGLILLDEPELHLNPSVCRKIIPFLLKEVLEPLSIQAIICTHSPEILAAAYENSSSTLLHLRTGRDISPIYAEDKGEVFEALRRLGAKPSDILFSKGSIYVEGVHDEELLIVGWTERITGYKLTKLGGRSEVEKEIKTLQSAEIAGKLENIQCFLFDNDRKQTALTSSNLVKIHQWERYCLENFLLDSDAIYDTCQSLSFKNSVSRGEIKNLLEEIALSELPHVVARKVYADLEPDNGGYRNELDKLSSYDEIGTKLFERLEKIKTELSSVDSATWLDNFKNNCQVMESNLMIEWKDKWQILANGKKVLSELHKRLGATCSELDFKRQIVLQMKLKTNENWRVIDSILNSLLKI